MAHWRGKLLALGVVLAVMLSIGGQMAFAQADEQKVAPQPHGILYDYFWNGGPIVRFIELPLSIVVVALAINFFIKYTRNKLMPSEEMQRIVSLLEARQYRTAIEETGRSTTLIGYSLNKALSLAPMGYLVMERTLEDALDERSAALSSKIEPLNIIGNVGPLIGLFGTVVGMIETFIAISSKSGGQVDATELAGGISTALVCTAWGLLIAIPGLAIYGVLRNRVERFANEAAVRGQEVLGIFRAGTSKPAAPAANAPMAHAPAASSGMPSVAVAPPAMPAR